MDGLGWNRIDSVEGIFEYDKLLVIMELLYVIIPIFFDYGPIFTKQIYFVQNQVWKKPSLFCGQPSSLREMPFWGFLRAMNPNTKSKQMKTQNDDPKMIKKLDLIFLDLD